MKYQLKEFVTDEMLEEWKPIKGYEKTHMVSNYGRFYSVVRMCIIKPVLVHGYNHITFTVKDVRKTFKRARIVAQHFIQNPLKKGEVNHKNGIKNDDRVENLEWVTRSENQRHKIDVLGFKVPQHVKDKQSLVRGNKHPKSILNEKQILEIKTKIRNGEKNVNLAKEYNVNKSYICNIKNGYSWGWLDYVEVVE